MRRLPMLTRERACVHCGSLIRRWRWQWLPRFCKPGHYIAHIYEHHIP